MRKAFVIARREYLAMVGSKAFLFSLAIMPVFMLGGAVIPQLLRDKVDIQQKRIAVLDGTGRLFDQLQQAVATRNENATWDRQSNRQIAPVYQIEKGPSGPVTDELLVALSDRVRSRELYGFIDLPADLLQVPADGKPPVVRLHDDAGGGQEISCPVIIAQGLPGLEYGVLVGPGQGGKVREAVHEPFEIAHHPVHLGLLGHDFGYPDRVGSVVTPPGQVPPAGGVPVKQRSGHFGFPGHSPFSLSAGVAAGPAVPRRWVRRAGVAGARPARAPTVRGRVAVRDAAMARHHSDRSWCMLPGGDAWRQVPVDYSGPDPLSYGRLTSDGSTRLQED